MKLTLAHDFTYADLNTPEGLAHLDACFLTYVEASGLRKPLEALRQQGEVDPEQESVLLLALAPKVEAFLGNLFGIESAIAAHHQAVHDLDVVFDVRRNLVQRQGASRIPPQEAMLSQAEQAALTAQVATDAGLGPADLEDPESERVLAQRWKVLDAPEALERARRYSAWRAHHNPGKGVLFSLQHKTDPMQLVPVEVGEAGLLKAATPLNTRDGFGCTTPRPDLPQALDPSHRCIICHPQGKDFCRKGYQKNPGKLEQNALGVSLAGCPLNQKISEMHALFKEGNPLAALAVIMVDNPMVPATGHRICNDCKLSCIFQKQDPVDTPMAETQILEAVLDLPWGVEVYSLLTRWNPLKAKGWLPAPPTGRTVLVAGMGPAGFTLAHALLQQGHRVIGVDAMKQEPLPESWIDHPIPSRECLWEPLEGRLAKGFGGVAEYGITARWDKNFLNLIRLVLARRPQFECHGDVLWGDTLTAAQAFDIADHVALCLGAGKPSLPNIDGNFPKGVFAASDFLMALHITNVAHPKVAASFQLQLPLVVVGGGLTAMDTATEALAFYPLQVEAFLKAYETGQGQAKIAAWPPGDQQLAQTFLEHGRAIRQERQRALDENRAPNFIPLLQAWGGVTILYRKRLQESPAYRLNAHEVTHTLEQGVWMRENQALQSFETDENGQVKGILMRDSTGTTIHIPCQSVLLATGTGAGEVDTTDDRVTLVGDLDPTYRGSVVKAMASAKAAALTIDQNLEVLSPRPPKPFHHGARVQAITPLDDAGSVVELTLHAPQAAQAFRPGHFFRAQRFHTGLLPDTRLAKPLTLTGIGADPEAGTLTLVVGTGGLHPKVFLKDLKPGDSISLMGPTGTPAHFPGGSGKTILFIGWDLCQVFFLPVAKALKTQGHRVFMLAGMGTWSRIFKRDALEAVYEAITWCASGETNAPPFALRPQDTWVTGNPLGALATHPPVPLSQVDRAWTMASVSLVLGLKDQLEKGMLPFPQGVEVITTLNAPMQCMMKGVCGQCACPTTSGQTAFLCEAQDQVLGEVSLETLQQRLGQVPLVERLG